MIQPISTFDFLIAASCSGSVKQLAQRLGMRPYLVRVRLLMLRRQGIVVRFQKETEL